MSFDERIKAFASRCSAVKNGIMTEEATKTSIIMPFFQVLGYDVFNPLEFTPEYIADVGIKKGEKIDYAILINNEPCILIEAKSVKEPLNRHDSQLFRYFGTTKAKFAILTNGLIYRFYTDLEEPNKMDLTPFLEIDIENLKDSQIIELKKFHKETFNVSEIMDTASELKYTGLMKNVYREQFTNPTDDLVRFVLNCDVFQGVKTQNVIDRFRPIVKKSFISYVNELVNERIQTALKNESKTVEPEIIIEEVCPEENLIITTEDEIQSYYIIKSLVRDVVDVSRIFYKDTQSYFGLLLDNKVTKWFVRLYYKENVRYIVLRKQNDEIQRIDIENLDSLFALKDNIVESLKLLLTNK